MKINKLTNGSKALLAGGLLCCLALAGCFREDLVPGKEGTPDEARTYGLGFTIAADALTKATDGERGSMQYGNEIENYIDPTQLRVLFLDKDGNFQYEFSQYEDRDEGGSPRSNDKLKSGLHLEPLRLNHDGGAVSQWFARIPIDQLSDEQLKLITDEGFKIAIMANWPEETFYGDAYGSINTNFLAGGEQNLANRLAHCHYDKPYTEDTDSETGIYESYLPFLGKRENESTYSQMSVSSEWVKSYFTDGKSGNWADAEAYIRAKYVPYGEVRAYVPGNSGRKYYDMWNIWNFGGDENIKPFAVTEKDQSFNVSSSNQEGWIKRNQANWGGVMSAIYTDENAQKLVILSDPEGNPVVTKYNKSEDGSGISTDSMDGLIFASKQDNANYTVVETPHGMGLMMPRNRSIEDHKNGSTNLFKEITEQEARGHKVDNNYGYIKIPIAADGFINFKVAAICDNTDKKDTNPHNVYVGVHFGSLSTIEANNIKIRSGYDSEQNEITDEGLDNYAVCKKDAAFVGVTDPVNIRFSHNITERAQDAYIYALCENGNDRLVIYEIEYIKAEHLSDIDRDGIRVSKDHPIPMYGIQDFDPIGAYWVPGELFNLSANNGLHPDNRYNYKWISLLRSVAKVELKIAKAPFGGKKPAYVYMRSMNRTARLNPIDVLTPTDQIWYGDAEHNIAGIKQETSNIQAYGPMYEKFSDPDPQKQLKRFHTRLAWFFGIWTHAKVGISSLDKSSKWDWNKQFQTEDIDRSIPYPRVFNPHINRSDYTHFIDMGEDDAYWYYMLYMPEKHMTDANNPGDLSEAPKCLRVEMRWPGVNDDSSLDDNASYRIYFADPNKSGHLVGEYNRDNYENVTGAYENDLENLKAFYPIVRNHLYQVTVSGINQGDISYTVTEPETRDVDIRID